MRSFDRFLYRLPLIIFALCAFGVAHAQSATRVTPCDPATPNNAICVTWSQVTADTTGVPISGVTYRVQQSTNATSGFSNVANGITATQYYGKNLAPTTYYLRVFAACASCTAESNASNTASGAATQIPIVPAAPVIIIAATIRADGPPTYRIIQSVTLKPNEVVMVAPAAMRPLFASR